MGYLSSVPAGESKPRSESWVMRLPDKGPLFYIWDWLCEFGVIIAGSEVSYTEVKAWSDLTYTPVTPDEARAICELSRIWLNNRMRGQDKDAIAPWFPEFD